jgi:hypothetical protein
MLMKKFSSYKKYFIFCMLFCYRIIAGIFKYRNLKIGVPKGIRTPVAAVKGQCPRPLDDGDII